MQDYHRLVYEPTPHDDRLAHGRQSGFIAVNPTLARQMVQNGVYELFFHANSKVTALVNSRDSNAAFKLLRLRRQWTGKLAGSPPSPLAINYVLETGISGPAGFGADYGESWFDTPGERLTGRTTQSYRALQEFITGVGEPNKEQSPVAEFGG
ncbi:MAG TPA: hypothetical protein VJ864_04235, partial [Candidatus Binatia bacterium]|nr:hypothetical protein [Candidatus Binatia bacterium]